MKKLRLNSCLSAEKTRVEKLHDRPQIADIVLNGSACQRDAVIGLDLARGSRLFCLRILDVLSFVDDQTQPNSHP